MLQVLQGLLQLRPQQPSQRTQLHAMLDRALVKLAKSLVGIQEAHPWCAGPLIRLTLRRACLQMRKVSDRVTMNLSWHASS